MAFQNLKRAHGFERARVEGEIPGDLRGILFRAGPGLFERNGRRVAHPFFADGAVCGVRFADRSAQVAARFVEGEHFRREEQAGRFLFAEGAGGWRRLWHSLRGTVKCTGNTSMIRWNERLFALMEGGRPVEMSPDTLDTLGERDFNVIRRAFSAHPHYVPARQATFNFGVRYGRDMKVDLYAMDERGNVSLLTTFTSPWRSMLHDFIATENHLIFYIAPIELNVVRALLGIGSMESWFQWQPDLGGEFLVVPIDDPENRRRVAAPPFWTWHYANAFEDSTDIVIDLATYDDLSTLTSLGSGTESALPVLERIRISARGQIHREKMLDAAMEFPTIPAHQRATRHDTVWGTTTDAAKQIGVARFDIQAAHQDAWIPDSDEQANEPLVDHQQKWLMSLIHSRARGESYVGVFAARDVSSGPRAKVWLGQRFPITYHGVWWPGC